MGGLTAYSERSPVSTAPFPELSRESEEMSWAEIDPDEGFVAKKESMASLYGP